MTDLNLYTNETQPDRVLAPTNTLDGSSLFPRRRRVTKDWMSWTSFRVFLRGLPSNVNTETIYRNLEKYGRIVRISIFETKEGDRSNCAEVTFEPPPSSQFWGTNIYFRSGPRDLPTIVKVQESREQHTKSTISSPIREHVRYEEKLKLRGQSLGFGVLGTGNIMQVFANRGDDGNRPLMALDLRRREIEITFSSPFQSNDRVALRHYRLKIALDDSPQIWHAGDGSYVLHVPRPPLYSKQLNEAVAQTHDPNAKTWSIEDTWVRQTDIFAHKYLLESINSSPISLTKQYNSINIARWTTFKFTMSSDEIFSKAAKTFAEALQDFNIKVSDVASFRFDAYPARHEHDVWKLVNGRLPDERPRSLDEELKSTELSFPLRYQLEVCLSQGWLSEYSITQDFLNALCAWPEAKARQALIQIDSCKQRLFDPMQLFADIEYTKPVRKRRIPVECAEICSVTVTATGILIYTPNIEITNRIIRKYKNLSNRFLRVRFEDDSYKGQTRLYPSSNAKNVMIYQRVKRTMRQGIKIGDVQFEFLAWGNSQLREHSAYFFASSGDVTATTIRNEMGDFQHEKVVAKRAARMGQCFSTTKPVLLHIPLVQENDVIPDIERNGYNFTDGVGKISPLAMELVRNHLRIKKLPSVIQFRLGGCKGVLALDPTMRSIAVKIRRSQFKFNSSHGELEVIRWSEYWQPYLNRQIITCLSSLGVSDSVFLQKQQTTIDGLNAAMNEDRAAIESLRSNVDPNQVSLAICDLVEARFREIQEPFVTTVLHLWRAWLLKSLKEKAKIPITKGAFVLGTVDETGTLEGHMDSPRVGIWQKEFDISKPDLNRIPQIFLQVTNPQTGRPKVIEGVCVLARNPSLHLGDIRIVNAINVPALHHMCDVVVMPQKGDRDLPSMCSGGDLDGDDYIVLWDQDMIPPTWNAQPFHYDPPSPKVTEVDITTNDLIEFFHDYLQNDFLGRIAHAHLGAADFLENGLERQQCLKLVELHSIAVDYPKTGIPAKMVRSLDRPSWPHFMEKKGKRYHSHKILGKLYDAVQLQKFVPKYELSFDCRILNFSQPSGGIINTIQDLKRDYDDSLRRILAQHSIRTEFELWSTFVLDHSKKARDYKFHEEVGHLSQTLKEQYLEDLYAIAGGRDFSQLAPIAVAAYQVTYNQLKLAKNKTHDEEQSTYVSTMPFISFPWLMQDTLIQIVNLVDVNTCFERSSISCKDVDATLADSRTGISEVSQHPPTISEPDGVDSEAKCTVKNAQDPYQSQIRDIVTAANSRIDVTESNELCTTQRGPAPVTDLTVSDPFWKTDKMDEPAQESGIASVCSTLCSAASQFHFSATPTSNEHSSSESFESDDGLAFVERSGTLSQPVKSNTSHSQNIYRIKNASRNIDQQSAVRYDVDVSEGLTTEIDASGTSEQSKITQDETSESCNFERATLPKHHTPIQYATGISTARQPMADPIGKKIDEIGFEDFEELTD